MFSQETINQIEQTKLFEKQNNFKRALQISETLAKKNENNFFLQNLNGYILYKLNNFRLSKTYFLKSIKLNKNFAPAYYLLGLVNIQHNELENGLENLIKASLINPALKDAKYNIIKILSSFKPKKNLDHPYVVTNSLIEEISFNYKHDVFIDNIKVNNFLRKSLQIVEKNLGNVEFPDMQIYRHNSKSLNCDRHFKIFNKEGIIPEFCFDCFKIVVEVNNILDLIKLYFVFDCLYVGLKNNRKVLVEQRPGVLGLYKGLIYSKNLDELNEIAFKLKKILKKNIGNNFTISTKRGCTEFSHKYPSYKIIKKDKDKMMSFKSEWRNKEKIIDEQIYNKNSENELKNKYLSGIKLNDILIMRNWLKFAKANGDKSIDL